MPESLSALLAEAFDAVNSIQGIMIAFITMMVMGRYHHIVFFAAGALLIDQFVTLAFNNTWNTSIEDIAEQFWDKLLDLDATVVIIRFVGFLVVITAMYGVKRLFLRGS